MREVKRHRAGLLLWLIATLLLVLSPTAFAQDPGGTQV